MNSSKIVLNTSASFSSLRIENPKKAGPMNEESENNLKLFVDNIPKINEIFNIECMVGEGTFSKVYKARHILTQVDFALKCVVPTIKPSRIIPELRYLRDLGGDSNIIDIKTCLFEAGYTVIVMPYFPHDRFSDYIKEMDMEEIRNYMRNLLIALRKVHSIGVIHRDIKPNNFLYNRREKKFALVDFGLAQNEADILKASKTFNRPYLNFAKKSKSKNQEVLKDNSKLTANSLFRKDSKMVCVRKRLLTEYDDENIIPLKFKKTKHESPIKQFKSSIFNTPSTPLNKAMNNMTNFQSNLSVTPLCFNMTANFDIDNKTLYQEKLNPVFQSADMYKTPTKKNPTVLGQIQNSPNSLIIPETPPKSAKSTIEPKRIFKNKLNSPAKVKKQSSVNSNSSNISVLNASCKCYSLEKICKICTKRTECMAPRAGTPGFRAPEVLLKQLCQTSAIDIWSCGVIFASLLTKKYPFFRNTDDLTSLAEIISIFGSERVNKAAQSIGKLITCSEKNIEPTDLRNTLTKLRGDQMKIDDSAFDLLDKLLDPNPYLRISASDALNHPFFTYY